jgi:hypothetical protein
MTNPVGRPTIYNDNIAREICDLIATTSKSLMTLCKDHKHWPGERTIRTWFREKPEFQQMYAQAKDDQSELFVEQIIDIADDASNDYHENLKGEMVFDSEHVQRSRLRVDTRKWLASKYKPKKYGDVKVPEEKESNTSEINADRELLHKCKTE